jgi:hypothetical protein
MRNLNTSAISSQASFKFKRGTFDHLQLAYREALDSLGRGLVTSYLTNTAYRLWGLVNGGNTTDYNISAGAVFYNGEVYLVDTAVFSAAVGETAVAVIVTTYLQDPTADPVTFTDGGARNVHEIKKIKFQSGLSGSGIADFASLKRANKGRAPKGCAIPYYPATGDLSEFDATGKGISVNTLGWALCNGQNGTVKLNGRVIAMYDPADSDFNNVGWEGGSKTTALTMAQLPAAGVDIVASDGTGISHGASLAGAHDNHRVRTDVDTQYGSVGWKTANLGTGEGHPNLQPYKVLVYIQEID